ncbi:hypothetical protein BD410DRAFT_900273 [Rickenella mellea]|uniref:Uncharacterized protein n=1 Tax=Rickenella mellea TaxID=50990 RepID=A0A4Y7PWC8_9AGAM|nr:hypothetical protein BD410DRAFT_900273 [Rickenella mellea]
MANSSLSSVVSNLVRASMGTSVTSKVTDEDLDKHVAELILKEAKQKAERYLKDGVHAYLPPTVNDDKVPKANKRFLSNIIRNTDEHNKAVLRAQAEAAQEIKAEREAQERRERKARADEAAEAARMLRSNGSSRTRDDHRRHRHESDRRRDRYRDEEDRRECHGEGSSSRSKRRRSRSRSRSPDRSSKRREDRTNGDDREERTPDRHRLRRRRSRSRSDDRRERTPRPSRRHHREDTDGVDEEYDKVVHLDEGRSERGMRRWSPSTEDRKERSSRRHTTHRRDRSSERHHRSRRRSRSPTREDRTSRLPHEDKGKRDEEGRSRDGENDKERDNISNHRDSRSPLPLPSKRAPPDDEVRSSGGRDDVVKRDTHSHSNSQSEAGPSRQSVQRDQSPTLSEEENIERRPTKLSEPLDSPSPGPRPATPPIPDPPQPTRTRRRTPPSPTLSEEEDIERFRPKARRRRLSPPPLASTSKHTTPPTTSRSPSPFLPSSKMDKYFAESYDPRLDVAPLSLPHVPSTGLIDNSEFEGWDAMLELIKQRRQDRVERKRMEKLGLLPTEKDREKEKERKERPVKKGDKEAESRWGMDTGAGIMDIEYKKKGSVREWDVGKVGFD